ncbi:MAG: hypothetical protein KY053_01490 [Candidatus Liptonbacteria bacterium]|nr:hypothetical protein [Candidatus Liptonbacteria bacterium]
MKIPKELLQFSKFKTLIIISGQQEAEFFFAYQGVIEKIAYFKLKKLTYSDKEGFIGRGRTKYGSSGSVLDDLKTKAKQEFVVSFKKAIKEIELKTDFDDVYLLSPSHFLEFVRGLLSLSLKGKIRFTLQGNYLKAAPIDVIKRISKEIKGR